MNKELGDKIIEVRNTRGMSQQELADKAVVSLRTIQRIEKNQNHPTGHTLRQICEALDVPVEGLLDYGKREDRSFLVVMQLSVLSYFVIPLGNIIIPLILWTTSKDKKLHVDASGKNLLNFQIIWTVISTISIMLWIFAKILHWPYQEPTLYFWLVTVLFNFLFPIYAAIKVGNGKSNCPYPRLLRIIR